MQSPARRLLIGFSAVALLFATGCAGVAPVDESASRIAVVFIEPEKFTDARRAELEPTASGILSELKTFIIATGAGYLPKDLQLNIRITDIDLAGDFELFRGFHADQVRITKGLYPPHIVLEYDLVDGTEQIVKTGKRDLTDINFQLRSAYPTQDYLRYEKDLLRDWLRDEFGALKNAKMG